MESATAAGEDLPATEAGGAPRRGPFRRRGGRDPVTGRAFRAPAWRRISRTGETAGEPPGGPGAAGDRLLIVAVTALLVVLTVFDGRPPRPGLPVLAGLSLAVCLPLPLRARLPLTAALTSAALALLGLTVPGWPGRLVAMGMFGAAVFHRPHRPWLVLVASVGWTTGYGLLTPRSSPGVSVVTDLVVMGVAPVAVGYALRLHGERARQTVRLNHAEARRAMAEERARLARDVHDSVGHHLTAIRMQATAVRRALDGASPTADRAFGTIAALASSALTEVRALLNTLRDEHAAAEPGLEEIEHLARRLSSPGLRIVVRRPRPSAPLPPAVDGTLYRVTQEALTNAARHSGATEVEVRVRRSRTRVALSIADNGPVRPGAASAAEGRGIRGMRERVLPHGGTLTAGPRRPHGWLVEAVLPITEGTT